MKMYAAAAVLSLLAAPSARAQTRLPSAPTTQRLSDNQSGQAAGLERAKIDPAKEADIRLLLDITGTKALVKQLMDGMEKNLKPMMINSLPPGDYRDQLVDLFFEKFESKADPQQLLDMAVPGYDKYLSDEEIKGLIVFYQTPLGQKALEVLPKLSMELQTQGAKWGQELGRQSMLQVLSEHPDLAQAMSAASKTAHPQ
jgi:uncharacterized protein